MLALPCSHGQRLNVMSVYACRDALPFVCRYFNRVYRSSKLLWGSMHLTIKPAASDAELAGLLPSLHHKGAAVAQLFVRLHSGKVALPELMAHFSVEGLRDLQLDLGTFAHSNAADLPARELRCLGRFTRLKILVVTFVPFSPPVDDYSWLSALTNLHSLSLLLNFHSANACTFISRLTALSALSLGYSFPADAQLSSMFAGLSRLQILALQLEPRGQLQLGAASFSHLQQLSELDVLTYHKDFENPSLHLQLAGLYTMPRLQHLTLQSCINVGFEVRKETCTMHCNALCVLFLHFAPA